MTPTVNIALDKSYKIKTGPEAGKYHAKIWVTFHRWVDGKKEWDQKPYKTGLFVTEQEFAGLMENDPKKKTRIERLKEIRKTLDAKKWQAEDIIDRYQIIDQRKFDLYFLTNHKPELLSSHYALKVAELRNAKPKPKISSAEKYETSLKSLQEFFGTPHVTFHDCTAERLQDYEGWYVGQDKVKESSKRKSPRAIGKKKSLTSVGINLRPLRHIFKRAIKRGDISEKLYPFGLNDDQYAIPEGGGDEVKKFLDTADKDLFLEHRFTGYQCDHEPCRRFYRTKPKAFPVCKWCRNGHLVEVQDEFYNELHDYAVFSYLGFGMNLADILRMRKSQLHPEHITLIREKAKGRKKKKNKKRAIPLHSRMSDIIRRRGKKSIGIPDDFVFPVINEAMPEEERFLTIRRYVQDIDRMLAAMSKSLKWEICPTLYTLRHTFSNEFMEMGGTTAELQDALGHEEERTTENYKHGFALARKKKFSQGLG